ncbi:MAG: hypothetical protein WC455_13950 [Dehalococcoidia bacterium]|jgi:hypothetical protein
MARREIVVEVDDALERKLSAIPARRGGVQKRPFTAQEDRAIMKHFNRIPKAALAETLGIAEGTLRKRYRELTAK